MSVIVAPYFSERSQSVDTDGEYMSASIPYFIKGAADEDAAMLEALSGIPDVFNGIPRVSISMEKRINVDTFRVVAEYEGTSGAEGAVIPDPKFGFDIVGGQEHISVSRATVAKYPTDTAPDFKQAINYDGEKINGLDVETGAFRFWETHYLPDSLVTIGFRRNLAYTYNKWNNAPFKGYQIGEVQFKGATGVRQGDKSNDLHEVTYNFVVFENRTSFPVGDITVAEKQGHDYLWVYFEKVIQTIAGKNIEVEVPKYVFIERIYNSADFATLGIGI